MSNSTYDVDTSMKNYKIEYSYGDKTGSINLAGISEDDAISNLMYELNIDYPSKADNLKIISINLISLKQRINKMNSKIINELLNLIKNLSDDKIHLLIIYIKSHSGEEYEFSKLINNGLLDKILNMIKNLSSNKYTIKDYNDYDKVLSYMSENGDSGGNYSKIIEENVPGALEYRWKPYDSDSDDNLNELLVVLDELIPIFNNLIINK